MPTALGGALLALALAGCPRKQEPPPRVRAQRGALRAEFGVAVTAGAPGPGGAFAVGTARGGVLVQLGGERLRLLADIGERPAVDSGTPQGHDGAITALDFSRDGRWLLSVGGRAAIRWDLKARRLVRRVGGPFELTAGVFDEQGAALFANTHGHVYRWRADATEAEAVKHFFCRPTPVPEENRRRAPEKRCRVGHYSYEDEQQVCLYPVTQMIRRGPRLARACREGTLAVLDLRSRRIAWNNVAGHLRGLTFVDDQQLFLARQDGQLRLWDAATKADLRAYAPGVRADAVAAGAGLIAVAAGRRVRLWRPATAQVAGAVTIPRRAVWLGLQAQPRGLKVLLADGRLVFHPLQDEPRR